MTEQTARHAGPPTDDEPGTARTSPAAGAHARPDAPESTVGGIFAEVATKIWWVVLLRGVVAIIFGIVALVSPWGTAAALAVVVGIFVIVEGVLDIVEAFRHKKLGGTLLHLVIGILSIGAGIVMLAWPAITLLILVYTVAFWAILAGIMQVVLGLTTKGVSGGARVWAVLGGVLSFAFGVLMLTQPASGLAAIIWLVGIYAIVFGIALVALAFAARSAARSLAADATDAAAATDAARTA